MQLRFSLDGLSNYCFVLAEEMEPEVLQTLFSKDVTVEYSEGRTVLKNVIADQAGVVGLIRHLHGMGQGLISVTWVSPVEVGKE